MTNSTADLVIAGHICLDIIPSFSATERIDTLLAPGELVEVGPPVIAAGGAVSNTGLALQRLGLPTRLMGKVSDDLFGNALLDVLRREDDKLADGMLVAEGENTSYTLVISPPGADRAFLHCPGANNTFRADDVPVSQLSAARFFHFGYPPLMRHMYADDGAEMAVLLQRVKEQGLLTSLDMAMPDPDSEAGQVDWTAWLQNVLPHVDLFGPSLKETLYMLGRSGDVDVYEQPELPSELAERLIDLGTGAVALKLGDRGLYLRTSPSLDTDRLPLSEDWVNREVLAPCFEVEVSGTTGAGDCTLGGLLAAMARGRTPENAVTTATAVGAFSVEAPDSTSGIPPLDALKQRIATGWRRLHTGVELSGWRWEPHHALWSGPADAPPG